MAPVDLWLPPTARRTDEPHVSREHRETTLQWEADVLSALYEDGPVLDSWNPELKQIDVNLRLMKARENAHVAGVLAGFYHLVRLRDALAASMLLVVPLRDPVTGGFIEPTLQMLEALRMSDLQNDAVVRDMRANTIRDQVAKDRDELREAQDWFDQAVEHAKAVTRTQVLMSPDVPWHQNFAGRRGRRTK